MTFEPYLKAFLIFFHHEILTQQETRLSKSSIKIATRTVRLKVILDLPNRVLDSS
jgi:hypothetical protein